MAYEQRPNSGTLFRNDTKTKDKQPDYTGDCLVNGEKWRISAWLKEGRKGGKFLSLSFSAPGEYGRAAEPPVAEDDIPF